MSMSLYASKEEYEQAHAARWYCLDRDGVAMLCKDEADARTQAAENDDCWPGRAPHRAVLLGEVSAADGNITVEVSRQAAQADLERLRAENAALKRDLQYARDGLTKGRTRMREDNERLAREAYTWSKAAETYAADLERHKPLMQAVEWLLDDGHMNTEHLARLRAAWEAALGPNVRANLDPTA